jgi:hypothetical protein
MPSIVYRAYEARHVTAVDFVAPTKQAVDKWELAINHSLIKYHKLFYAQLHR